MKDAVKGFLLQWVLPTVIFIIVLIFTYGVFTANIKEETVGNYENDIITATIEDATEISSSVIQVEAVCEAMIDVITTNNLAGLGATDVLKPLVDCSDAYMAVYMDGVGKATRHTGQTVNIKNLPYFDVISSLPDKGIAYVYDDGIEGRTALVIKMKIGGEANKYILLYYPVDSENLKDIVEVGKNSDSPAMCTVIDEEGNIFASVPAAEGFEPLSDYWTDINNGNNASTIKRAKTKAMSKVNGSFEANVGGKTYLIAYTTIPNTSLILLTYYDKENVSRAESEQLAASKKRLGISGLIIGIFILTITIINVARLYARNRNDDELKDKADKDLLTGLKNKTATEREIKEYMEQHPDTIGAMFLIDIDNFKKINDTMGHAFGDEVLRELGRNIGINFRVSDIIGRTGGDEFMIFLKNLKEDANTLREAQKLIYFFRHFQVGDYVKYSVTASIGAAVFPDHGTDFETLYKAADAAVYKSKKRGKNQLSFYDDRDRTPEEVAYADSHLIDIERKEESTPIEN